MAEGNDKISTTIVPLLQQELPQHVLAGYMRYQKIRALGRGGKAEVFLCRDQTLGREVAVKVLHPELLSSAEEQHMLVREARIMAALVQPGIPKIHDLGRDFERRPYFAMSYVPGTTFRDMLASARDTPDSAAQQYELQRCLNVLIEVGEILRTVHSLHVIHGDLKPENIIVGPRGEVHLIDWGLATILQHDGITDEEPDAFASERGFQGSPLYMAPEQATHSTAISEATDIYSLGVLLYECLTLTTPYRGTDVHDVIAKVVAAEIESPRQQAPGRHLPADLERACMKALRKCPDQRQASMSEFIAELRECHLELLIDYDRAVFSDSRFNSRSEASWRDEPLLAYV
jgi:eukaryotic-like serine/threonine-protein kinase